MRYYTVALERLIEKFEQLPGIGHKSAQRLAFHVLDMEKKNVEDFANVLVEAKEKVKYCKRCFHIADTDTCKICADLMRDQGTVCVVEDFGTVIAMEKTGGFKGVYHVLHGVISPMDGKGPNDLRIKELLKRVEKEEISEVIMATNPDLEGEATAMYVSKLLKPFGVKTTRIAYGVPVGGDLEYADEVTLLRALEGRKEL